MQRNHTISHIASLLLSLLCILCCTVSAGACERSTFETLDFNGIEGVSSVITDIDGVGHTFSGALDIEKLANAPQLSAIASYRICMEGEELLCVTLHDILPAPVRNTKGSADTTRLNGYYAVRFSVDETHEAFITGLSERNVGEIQAKLIASKLTRYFTLTDIDFIDAEKQGSVHFAGSSEKDSDLDLCWAAASSNILWYTGWAKKADPAFTSSDDVLDLFTKKFSDEGGLPCYGFDWFFNGINLPEKWGWSKWATVNNDSGFTGYLPDYSAMNLCRTITAEQSALTLRRAFDCLEQGCGIELGIDWYKKSVGSIYMVYNGGHSTTLWGYVRDLRYSDRNDPHAYSAILIADSDSNMYDSGVYGIDRRLAPNILHLLETEPYTVQEEEEKPRETWKLYYSNTSAGYLNGFTVLQPYSDAVLTETEGTKNRFTTGDLSVDTGTFKLFSTGDTDVHDRRCFEDGASISCYYEIANYAASNMLGSTIYRCYITEDRTGEVVWRTKMGNLGALRVRAYSDFTEEIGELGTGNYTFTIELNPNRTAKEAYYSDNVFTEHFTVGTIPEEPNAAVTQQRNEADEVTANLVSFVPTGDGIYQIGEYDPDGRLLSVRSGRAHYGESLIVSFASHLADAKRYKIFQLAADTWIPICDAAEVVL